jgi:cell division protease FtsH
MNQNRPPPRPSPGREGGSANPLGRFPIWYLLLMLLMLWVWQETVSHFSVRTISYSEFKTHLAGREVVEVAVKPDEISGRIELKTAIAETNTVENASAGQVTNAVPAITNSAPANPFARLFRRQPSAPAASTNQAFLFRTVRVEDPDLVKELQAAEVKITGVRPSLLSQFLLAWMLPLALMIALWVYLGRKMRGAGGALLNIGKSGARLVADKDTGVRFKDVAGCDEAKFELQEVVDFLKNPKRYEELGAKIPKGALLLGPPGTGKTLLARAVAGEAKVPFFSISGSDFVEMFVGVGAARVRDLFEQAKKHAPCIIFIDELDAVGRQRGVHVGAVNDEREQTLNALLVQMDGFEANTGVIILSATNRPEVLDRALLRPGRFDRQIVVDAPDLDGRHAILKVHAKGKPLAGDADLRRLAAATAGFSGADLANALNEAALLAARRQSPNISQRDLEDAIEKVVAGPERKSRRLNDDDKRRVAYHEVGHALVAAHSQHADPVHKISIIPRGRGALGYTMQLPAEDQFLLTRTELLDRLRGLLGGRAAEEVIFKEVSTGAQNDLERATALARQMVALYGMSEKVGLTSCLQRPPVFLQAPDQPLQRDCSEQTARDIDDEVKKFLDQAYTEAKELLRAHLGELEKVTAELLQCESLDAAAFYQLIGKPAPRERIKPPAPLAAAMPAAAH